MSDLEAEATKHLFYLETCITIDKKIKYLSAVMRACESRGALRGGQEMAEAVQKAQVQSTDRPIGAVYKFSTGGCEPITE